MSATEELLEEASKHRAKYVQEILCTNISKGSVITKPKRAFDQQQLRVGCGKVVMVLDYDRDENPQVTVSNSETGELLAIFDGRAGVSALRTVVRHLERY